MDKKFDIDKARKNLQELASKQLEQKEEERSAVLALVIKTLQSMFAGTDVEVYLVGSIIVPYKFHSKSDVDVVVKNFKGDRFDLWTELESLIKRNVEVIRFENCHFQEHVIKEGFKVV